MKQGNSNLFLYVLLGALTAFGPFVTDMYLPSLPSMVNYFHTHTSMVQLGLTTSMIGLAAGQLVFGPLSDKKGRKQPLIAALVLFLISTIGCIYSPSIGIFLFFRLIQGLAGAGGIVISRSVATDSFSNVELAKAMAIIGAINGIAPVAAPVIGGFLTDTIGWKGIFSVLLVIGVFLLSGTIRFKESLPAENRKQLKGLDFLLNFLTVLKNKAYVCYVLQNGFAMGVLFVNISSSPFIIQQHYGFSALAFSAVFGINSAILGVAAGLSVKFRKPENATLSGCLGMVGFSALECIALAYGCSFWIYELLLVGILFMLGLTFTSSTTLAMSLERKNSGTASALFGASGFAFGGIVSPLVGVGDILNSTGLLFFVCSLLSLISVLFVVRLSSVSLLGWLKQKIYGRTV